MLHRVKNNLSKVNSQRDIEKYLKSKTYFANPLVTLVVTYLGK